MFDDFGAEDDFDQLHDIPPYDDIPLALIMAGVYDEKSLKIARRKQIQKNRYEDIQRQALQPTGANRDNNSTADHGNELDETIKELNMLSARFDKDAHDVDREGSSLKHKEVPSSPNADDNHGTTNYFQQAETKDECNDQIMETENARVKRLQRFENTGSGKNVTPNVSNNRDMAPNTGKQAPVRGKAFKSTPDFEIPNDPVPTAMKMASKTTVPQKTSRPNVTTSVAQGKGDAGTPLERNKNSVKASNPSIVTGSKPSAMKMPKDQSNTKTEGAQTNAQMAKDDTDSDENLPIPAALKVAKKTAAQQKSPTTKSSTPVETYKNDTTVKRDTSATYKFRNKNQTQPSGVTPGTVERKDAQDLRQVSDKICDIENIEAVLDKKAEEISHAFRKFKDQQSRMYKCPGLLVLFYSNPVRINTLLNHCCLNT